MTRPETELRNETAPKFSAPTPRLDRFLAEKGPPTPCVVIDLNVVRARFAALRDALPAAEIYYAVKANPAAEIVAALAALGAKFDLASLGELDICRRLDQMSVEARAD